MRKSGVRKGIKPRIVAKPSAAARRRAELGPAVTPQRPARSVAMRLAEKVERLERELAAAQAQMAELEARTEIDPLTDLVNRRGLERELKRALAYVKRYGTGAVLIYLDLDGFKSANDRYGHAAGDAVLKAIAVVLRRHVRACDLVARHGGDEFVVLLWNLDAVDGEAKARALEAAIARTSAIHQGKTLAVGASAGSTMLLPLDTPASVLDRADRAMYARKSGRRGEMAAE
jgi:diguanylate cyclase (GGDEF)-like protein